jgi:hypothetical protein
MPTLPYRFSQKLPAASPKTPIFQVSDTLNNYNNSLRFSSVVFWGKYKRERRTAQESERRYV